MQQLSDLFTSENHSNGAEIQVINPDGKKTDFFISVCGRDSKEYILANKAAQTEILLKSQDKDNPIPQEDMLRIEVAIYVAITKSWRGLFDGNKEVEFSAKLAKDLYTNAPYITNQIEMFIRKNSNFTKG